MQARVWQDHFLRERNQQVPMMRRTLQNMEYYIGKEPGGCYAASMNGRIVGSIISHVWGSAGWFGPLEVEADLQGQGIGKLLVNKSVEYLRARGCTTIGCETMASSPRNIAFYQKQGFRPRNLSHVLFKHLLPPGPGEPGEGHPHPGRIISRMDGMKELWGRILPGMDYSEEAVRAESMNLGSVHLNESTAGPAHAIVHTYEMFEDSRNAIIKLLVAGHGDIESADKLLRQCEITAAAMGKTGMFIRTYDTTPPELDWFLSRGYILQSNSIRLILEGPDEAGENIHISCWSG